MRKDISGSSAAWSPIDGDIQTKGAWTSTNVFSTTSTEVPHICRSYLFRKLDNFVNECPLVAELSFLVHFSVPRTPLAGMKRLTMSEVVMGHDPVVQ